METNNQQVYLKVNAGLQNVVYSFIPIPAFEALDKDKQLAVLGLMDKLTEAVVEVMK
jgi:hypothetical protein